MTKKEFAVFSMALKTYYPKENIFPNDKAMELWFEQLQDIPYEVASAGLKKWVSINKWSPSIAEIREMAVSIVKGDIVPWGDAWEEVQRAIRKFGSYRADEGLNSLSPITRKATEQIGFTTLCLSENPSSDRANFRMIYEQLAERERREEQVSVPVKNLIRQIQNQMIEDKGGSNG